ncbi:hypothetical protein MJN85_30590, partial [Salmonella enterica subsp. enterica serovar Anatum]|nr:hypothetical protein [Salmonella enterica subsp. enterica serovar Anatum]
QQGKTLHLEASSDASVLLLSGEPLNEPIVGYGPFVMNTKQEMVLQFGKRRDHFVFVRE